MLNSKVKLEHLYLYILIYVTRDRERELTSLKVEYSTYNTLYGHLIIDYVESVGTIIQYYSRKNTSGFRA